MLTTQTASRCRRATVLGLLALSALATPAQAPQPHYSVQLLPWSQQIAVREKWLAARHALLLEMMRRNKIDMWIVVNEEFHNDPLTEFIAPPRPYTGNRDIFIFIDTGKDLRKVALTGYGEENVQRFFESEDDPKPAKEALAALYAQYHPQRIGLSIDAKRGVQRSLTRDSYKFLAEAMGPDAEKHFVPAADLIEEYLSTRLPEEFETYKSLVKLTDEVTRRGLSGEVIVPGKTTVGDLRNWFYDQMGALGLGTWFQTDFRVQRKGLSAATSRGFLAVAKENVVIERGDLVHIDFGMNYMGFSSDWQKEVYILREGETDAPAGLKHALANTNTLQDAVMLRAARPGRTGAEVYNLAMKEMTEKGIEAKIYSHPIGNQGHGLGPGLDYRSAQLPIGEAKPLRKGTYISIELNTATSVPEWDGQKVFVMEEDDAYLTDDGYRFFMPRQEAFYLVH